MACIGNERRIARASVLKMGLLGLWIAVVYMASAPVAHAQSLAEPDAGTSDIAQVVPVRTESPRETFRSFLKLGQEMEAALLDYLEKPTLAGMSQLALLSDEISSLLDLEPEAAASRRETGIRTMTYLLDIFGRLPPIDPEDIPDAAELEAEGAEATRIPGTPLYIKRMTEAERFGEYLFANSTIDVAPRFFRSVGAMPLRTALPTHSFSSLGPQLTGPLIPSDVVAAMPSSLRKLWLDTPAWKVLVTVVLAALMVGVVASVHFALARVNSRSRIRRHLLQLVMPVTILLLTNVIVPEFSLQINLSGRFADIKTALSTMIAFLAYAWLFWVAILLIFEAIILSPGISEKSLDANLLRLVSNVLGIIGAVVIVAFGGQEIGIPILSLLAGLGIGGLAIALALQPTLENLVGGVILYLDRPVRVGDFCKFGEQMGTIESIGVRSTKLRALDRTIITVPNAQFADLQIVNFAYCDRMLLHTVIGVRYETSPDQLRYLLASMGSMLHAHPRIERETVRVRVSGYGASSIDIDVRIYIETREWNDFFAIREDVFLRIYSLVEEAGTGFAFPSQTLYLGRDQGLDPKKKGSAESVVRAWRDQGELPFPTFSSEQIDGFEGKLDYPPEGSVLAQTRHGHNTASAADDQHTATDETLSAAEPLSTPEPLGHEEPLGTDTEERKT